MSSLIRLTTLAIFLCSAFAGGAQTNIKATVVDAVTHEAIAGASVHCTDAGCTHGCTTNASGVFEISCNDCKTFAISFVGYNTETVAIEKLKSTVALNPSTSVMNEVVISASRGETIKRSEAPVAISAISAKTLQETKATSADQLLNKVSGVNMVNLGNEQHQMSIRQPMTTKSLFLYLEDGIPVRTTGLYNHNALLEMNMAAVKSIEVIKGPSSAMYGSEAVGGVVNFITIAPTAFPLLKVSAQANNGGYKRTDLQSSFSKNNWGFVLSGYYAQKKNGFMDYSDFHKATLTGRVDYRFSDRTSISNTATWLNYYSDMPGGVDSLMFATRKFINPQTFTYRKVNALRLRTTLTQSWNDHSKTTASAIFRDNSIGQNPAYRIKDDYKKQNGTWVGLKDVAHGEINESSFNSLAFIGQHRQEFGKKLSLVGGISADLSPSSYDASYIRIKKDTVARKYVSYENADSTLTNYSTQINNYAAFANLEYTATPKLKIVGSLRYDLFQYKFDNHLAASAFSGSADTVNNFYRLSPKIGFTYNFSARTGVYANYSQGFVPPQVSDMYTGVKVPNLNPAVFFNYEVGGWMQLVQNKLSMDASVYKLDGTNEVISVKLDDGSTENQNAGKTSHKGIEFGINATPSKQLSVRVSGAFSTHRFVDFVEKGTAYNGNEMNGAPHWMHNAEVWYRPSFIPGFRIGAEWQKIGNYFVDAKNTAKYQGYNVFNLRTGYRHNAFEVWVNVMNITDNYFAYIVTKGSNYSYQLAEPRNFNIGISYDLASLIKSK